MSLQEDHSLAAVAGWFQGDWVERNGYYRPLTSVSLWLDYLVWGPRHRGYLLTNWLLHCLTAWALALLAVTVLRSPVAGVLAGSVCALVRYPSIRATLVWMSTRTDVLCGLLCLVALYAGMVWIRCGRWPRLVASCGSAAAALLSKEMAIVLPSCLLLCASITCGGRGWLRTAVLGSAVAGLTALAMVLVRATDWRALWLFAGWEVISCVLLLGVRFATMH